MPVRESLLDRFCRYVRIDTQSSATSTTYPSTEKQKDLLRVLVDDLKAAGLADAEMDEFGYVMATLPSNIPPGHPAFGKVPTIGLLGHVDTYHEVSGTDVKPQVHRNYDGGDIALPGDPTVVIRAADEPALAACKGMTSSRPTGRRCWAPTTRRASPRSSRPCGGFTTTPRAFTGRFAWPSRPMKKSAAAPSTST